jgi:hypothetical protein
MRARIYPVSALEVKSEADTFFSTKVGLNLEFGETMFFQAGSWV